MATEPGNIKTIAILNLRVGRILKIYLCLSLVDYSAPLTIININYAAQVAALYSELNLQCLNKFSPEGVYFDILSQSHLLKHAVVSVFTLVQLTIYANSRRLQTMTNLYA